MAITRATGPYTRDLGPPAPTSLTYSITTLGDLVVLSMAWYQGTANSISGVTGGGVTTWHRATTLYSTANVILMEVWYGSATSTGSVTATVSYTSTASVFGDLHADTFTAGLGSGTVWTLVSSNTISNAASNSWNFPSVTSGTATNQLYYGWANSYSSGGAAAGSTSGFTYNTDAGDGDILTCFNGSLATSTGYQPNGSASGTAGLSFAIGVIFSAASGSTTLNGTGSVAGVGTLAGTGTIHMPATAVATGVGTLAGAGIVHVSGTGTLTGSGTLAGTGVVHLPATGSVVGVGTLAGTGSAFLAGSSGLTGSGTLAGAGSIHLPATAALVANGTLAGAAGPVVLNGTAALVGSGTLAGAGTAPVGLRLASVADVGVSQPPISGRQGESAQAARLPT